MKPGYFRSFSDNGMLQSDSPISQVIQGIRSDYIALQASRAFYFGLGQYNSHFRLGEPKELRQVDSATFPSSRDTKTVVVVPSIDLDGKELKRMCGENVELYEERQLYHLLLLRDPSFRIIYLSSHQISSAIVRYYLTLDDEKATNLANRLARLYLLRPARDKLTDPFFKSLSNNAVQDEKLMKTIKHILFHISGGDCPCAGLSLFCGSLAADQLAQKLDLRLLEAKSEHLYFGCKQGRFVKFNVLQQSGQDGISNISNSREIFAKLGIPHAVGTPDFDVGDEDLLSIRNATSAEWADSHQFIRTPRALSIGIARQLLIKNVKAESWIIKLNQGFSGRGNAMLDLSLIQEKIKYLRLSSQSDGENSTPLITSIADEIELTLPNMRFECPGMTWMGSNGQVGFKQQIESLGAVAEAFLDGNDLSSPSVQGVIEPEDMGNLKVRLLSTHEQILDGQMYRGCTNPASELYRDQILNYTEMIGVELSNHGIIGHFAVDFIVTSTYTESGVKNWTVEAIEINLRQGGTTHPYSTMALLCGGKTDRDGIFRTIDGHMRCYMATDTFNDDRLVQMRPAQMIALIKNQSDPLAKMIEWSNETKTGVVFHILQFVSVGKIGFTAIGSSKEEAKILFDQTVLFLERVAMEWSAEG